MSEPTIASGAGRAEALTRCFSELTASLGQAQTLELAELLHPRSFGTGDILLAAGSQPDGIGFLVKGKLGVVVGGDSAPLAVCEAGAMLWEVSTIDPTGATASLVAAEAGQLLVLPTARLDELARSNVALASAVMREVCTTMAERTRHCSDQLDQLRGFDKAPERKTGLVAALATLVGGFRGRSS